MSKQSSLAEIDQGTFGTNFGSLARASQVEIRSLVTTTESSKNGSEKSKYIAG